MCGFLISNVNFNNSIISNTLSHRGPDDTKYFKDENININFNRLSIIDLNKRSNQPMRKDDNLIIFNGEIYNYLELRDILKKRGYNFKTKSDTEVLLFSFLEWGKNCLDRFEGMFAFCIYDIKKKNYFCCKRQIWNKTFIYI